MKRKKIIIGLVAMAGALMALAGSNIQQYALHGYCPVALHKGMFMKGSDHFVTEYNGKVYTFVKFQAQKAFLEHPEVFLTDAAQKYEVLEKKNKAASDM